MSRRYPGLVIRVNGILIHAYFGIDVDIVWDVIRAKLPGLGERGSGIPAEGG